MISSENATKYPSQITHLMKMLKPSLKRLKNNRKRNLLDQKNIKHREGEEILPKNRVTFKTLGLSDFSDSSKQRNKERNGGRRRIIALCEGIKWSDAPIMPYQTT